MGVGMVECLAGSAYGQARGHTLCHGAAEFVARKQDAPYYQWLE